MANKGSKAAVAANPWLWLIGLAVVALLWRWGLLVGGIWLLFLAAGTKRRNEVRAVLGVGGLLCLGLLAWSVFPTTPATVAETPTPATTAPAPAPETAPTPDAAPPAATIEHPTEAETYSNGFTVVVGQTTWKQYAQLLPLTSEAPSKMKFTGALGDMRLWTTTFNDGSTMNAIFDKRMVLWSFDTDTP